MTAVAEMKKKASGAKLALPLRSLQKAMAIIAPAIERKTTIPILGNVRIEQMDGAVEFVGTNLDMTIKARIAIKDAAPATAFLLPALKLESYAKLLQGDTVTFEPGESRASLRCGRSNTKLPVQPLAGFPTIPESPQSASIRVKQSALQRLLRFVSFAVYEGDDRASLQGALVEMQGDTLTFVSTDGHRLARYTVPIETDHSWSSLAPIALLKALEKTIGADADAIVRIEATDQTIFAAVKDDTGLVTLAHRKLTGQFPNYKAVIPSESLFVVTVSAEEARAALRRAITFSQERSGAVKLTISPEEVRLHAASAELGETDDTFGAASVKDFEPFSIGFNGEYLIDALSRLSGNVELRFGNSQQPLMIVAQPAEGEQLDYVVMPMRV